MYKKYLKSLIFSIAISLLASSYASAKLIPLKKEWDFGRVRQGETKLKSFQVKNKSKEKIEIRKIHACCGYNIDFVSAWELKPNQSAQIDLVCNAKHKSIGEDSKYVTIYSTSQDNIQLKIPVKAQIVESDAKVREISFDQLKKEKEKDLAKEIPSITAKELRKKMLDGETLIVLDVREKSEYAQKHITNSMRFSRSQINKNEGELKTTLRNVEKPIHVIVLCAGGTRSAYIVEKLRSWGRNSFNLLGGLKAWEKEGYPLAYGKSIPQDAEPLQVTLEEAYNYYYRLFGGKTIWIDTREEKEYKKGHIKGGVNIPLADLELVIDSIPRNKPLMLYCEGPDCDSSTVLGRMLIEDGFKQGKAIVFKEGYRAWKKAGYPVD